MRQVVDFLSPIIAVLSIFAISKRRLGASLVPVVGIVIVPAGHAWADTPLATAWDDRGWMAAALVTAGVLLGGLLLVMGHRNRRLEVARRQAVDQANALAAERQRLTDILWGTNAGSWEWNIESGELVWSDRWAQILGYTLAELQPVNLERWRQLAHPEDKALSDAAMERHLAGITDAFEVECRMRHRDGHWTWVLARGKVVDRDAAGRPRRVSGTHMDITPHKATEAAALQAQHRLEVILNSVSEGIYGVDAEGRTVFVNRAATDMLGWSADDLLDRDQHSLTHHSRADGSPYPVAECPIHRTTRDHQLHEVNDEVFWRKDGTSFPVEYVCSPVADEDGGTSAAVVVFRNIGERARLLQELARSNTELEQFAYVVSHDLRAPLRMVNSYATLLQRRLRGKLDAEGQEFLHFMTDGATRMDRMLVSLLEYSRVGRKGQPMEWVDSRSVLDDALFFLEPDIQASAAEVTVTGRWPTVFACRDELTRLFQNLLGNAVKYRDSQRPLRITVTTQLTRGEWRFAIEDNGIGIEPAQMGKLFQVFQRLHGPEAYDGDGIGLAVCRKIVERHGGHIWIESEGEGKGCRFLFTLPAGAADDHKGETA